jgi:hypothetical protein
MKSLHNKTALLAATVLSVSAYAGLASAHCHDETFGAAVQNADLYRVHCDTGDGSAEAPSLLVTDHLFARVIRTPVLAGAGTAYAQIGKEGFSPSAISTDTVATAGASCATPLTPGGWVKLNPNAQLAGASGNGDYNILVNKSAAVALSYSMEFHCTDSTQNVTPTVASHTVTMEVIPGGAAPELGGNSLMTPDIDMLIDN